MIRLANTAERAVGFFNDLITEFADFFCQPASSYCRLETADGDGILVTDNGSLVSLVELHGSLSLVGRAEFENNISSLERALASIVQRRGQHLQLVFHYDPLSAHRQATDLMRPSRVTAKNLGLDCDDLLRDWARALGAHTSVEKTWVIVWTLPSLLSPSESKRQQKAAAQRVMEGPPAKGGQAIGRVISALRDSHVAACKTVIDAFGQINCPAELVGAHDAVWWIRHLVDPEFTARGWRPLLPGDRLPLTLPDPTDEDDFSSLLYPSIKTQVWPRDAICSYRHVRIGQRVYSPVVLHLPPQTEKPFNALFRRLIDERIPWRVSFTLGGDGQLALKRMLAAILHFTSTQNKLFNRAVEALDELEVSGVPLCAMQANFVTWVTDAEGKGNADEQIQLLQSRTAILSNAIQAWGAADTREVVGDPLLGVAATLPGMTLAGPAPSAMGPFERILRLLPLARPASPWAMAEGSVLFRSQDGKLLPVGLLSSRQASWIELGFAPMGAGKSVLLNTLNLCRCLIPGQPRLPHICIIDVGPSSSGLITLLKDMLPPDQKHLVAYHRLKMTKDYSINPFDTPLGCRRPLPSHESFLVNLLCLLCTPLDQDSPPDGVAGLAREAIREAYNDADEIHPKPYQQGLDPQVDALVESLRIELDEATCWWEIVDALFHANYHHEASRAQRFAVPILQDIIRAASNPTLSAPYTFRLPNNETVIAFVVRSLNEALNSYPILTAPTQFDIGGAQILSLDLDEVAKRGGPGGDRQTGLMYMLARHVGAGRFFLMPDDVKDMPNAYRAYHAERIDEIRGDLKYLGYDEVHRARGSSMVTKQFIAEMETAARESRKWNLGIGLWSQTIDDFPPIMVDLATSIYILGSGTAENAKKLQERFDFSDAARIELQHISKPSAAGASCLAVFRTDRGMCVQLLTNTLGVQARWAFSTTAEDRYVRDALYARLGSKRTLKLLSERYPNGVKAVLEQRKTAVEERGLGSDSQDFKKELIDDLLRLANESGQEGLAR
jgi:intracellular multiplication protein IcmB